MSADLIESRFAPAYELLKAIASPPVAEWETGYELYREGLLGFPRSMVLLHPLWHGSDPHQGPRGFRQTELRDGERCRADVVWGYACALSAKPHYDHLYPYSLGGPTIGDNRIVLCEVHNSIKGPDIHLFPWERGEPPWVATHLARIADRRSG